MQTDLPHTLYMRDKKRKSGGNAREEFAYNPTDPAIEKTLESIRRRKERMEKEGKQVQYTMDEIFKR